MILFLNTSKEKQLDVFLIKKDKIIKIIDQLNLKGDFKVSENLLKMIDKLLRKNKLDFKELKSIIAVICPGPFISLRIGVAVANTLAYSLNIPVVGIPVKKELTNNQIIKSGLQKLAKAKIGNYISPFYAKEPNITIAKQEEKMIKLKNKNIKLKHLSDLTWQQVFEIWRKNEEGRTSWIGHYEGRGFSTWHEWRMSYVKPLGLAKLKWQLYDLQNPEKSILGFRGGPYRSWIKLCYENKNNPYFSEIIKHPNVIEHKGIKAIFDNFPSETTLIGVVIDSEIIIIEGMHRACALALAGSKNISLNTNIKIALAEYDSSTIPAVGMQTKE